LLKVINDPTIKTNIVIPMVFIGCVHMKHFPSI